MAKTYDPRKYIASLGTLAIGGLGVDSIKVTPAGDGFVKGAAGMDGSVERTLDARTDFDVEIVVQQTSPYNDALTILHKADRATGAGYFPVTIKDVNGATLHFARQGWIKQFTEDEKGKEASMNTWVIETGRADQFIGGSTI